MEQFIIDIVHQFKQLSYAGIIMALTFEFIPAEIVLPLVGYWVFQGDMNLWLAILAGSIGGVTGPLTLYALGKYGGRPLILKYGKYFLIREREIVASERFFAKYGAGVAFFGRFIPGVRTAISLPCGMANMSLVKFIAYTYAAMLPITSLYVYLGYRLGPKWKDVAPLAKAYLMPVAIVIAVLLVCFVVYHYVKRKVKLV
ncbi:DedA family protein [Paenibacillus sp. ACRRX]|uniref:DedA family protein n=1 Tax=unclassified Paenibacillus TaxID=185978 RepID=UPI001EF57FEC|nr:MULTISPECIES: DedA family protein [unclassified Paenibacillus]MCG7407255.1 DedA family protein [Paenibacillus sp. ACRRX]MDK8180474.1 DedA family protein [Paenibacillus sp. UMB4589-SE434]